MGGLILWTKLIIMIVFCGQLESLETNLEIHVIGSKPNQFLTYIKETFKK